MNEVIVVGVIAAVLLYLFGKFRQRGFFRKKVDDSTHTWLLFWWILWNHRVEVVARKSEDTLYIHTWGLGLLGVRLGIYREHKRPTQWRHIAKVIFYPKLFSILKDERYAAVTFAETLRLFLISTQDVKIKGFNDEQGRSFGAFLDGDARAA